MVYQWIYSLLPAYSPVTVWLFQATKVDTSSSCFIASGSAENVQARPGQSGENTRDPYPLTESDRTLGSPTLRRPLSRPTNQVGGIAPPRQTKGDATVLPTASIMEIQMDAY